MRQLISYPVSPKTPLYPGTSPVSCLPVKSIERGDRANTSQITVSNHTGTHIDAPRHFCPDGETTRKALGTCFEITPVYCVDVPLQQNAPIDIATLKPYLEKIPEAQGLLVRTGMYRTRAANPKEYCEDHPWVHPELPAFLRTICPSIRLFGTDTISISNPKHRDEGRACHRAFLCGADPILIAEDLNLSNPELATVPLRVTFYPWIVDDLDGVPVIAFAEPVDGAPSHPAQRPEHPS